MDIYGTFLDLGHCALGIPNASGLWLDLHLYYNSLLPKSHWPWLQIKLWYSCKIIAKSIIVFIPILHFTFYKLHLTNVKMLNYILQLHFPILHFTLLRLMKSRAKRDPNGPTPQLLQNSLAVWSLACGRRLLWTTKCNFRSLIFFFINIYIFFYPSCVKLRLDRLSGRLWGEMGPGGQGVAMVTRDYYRTPRWVLVQTQQEACDRLKL
jgi:hypothetical protein